MSVLVYAGSFASQPLAYAHVLDAAESAGLRLDLDHVEVICGGDPRPRLAHVFDPATTETLCEARCSTDTLVLVFPEALVAGVRPFGSSARLRFLGRYAPARPRILA